MALAPAVLDSRMICSICLERVRCFNAWKHPGGGSKHPCHSACIAEYAEEKSDDEILCPCCKRLVERPFSCLWTMKKCYRNYFQGTEEQIKCARIFSTFLTLWGGLILGASWKQDTFFMSLAISGLVLGSSCFAYLHRKQTRSFKLLSFAVLAGATALCFFVGSQLTRR